MVKYLKKADPQSQQADRALSERVRAMLDDIAQNGDAAVRRYAKDLDRWERPETPSNKSMVPKFMIICC